MHDVHVPLRYTVLYSVQFKYTRLVRLHVQYILQAYTQLLNYKTHLFFGVDQDREIRKEVLPLPKVVLTPGFVNKNITNCSGALVARNVQGIQPFLKVNHSLSQAHLKLHGLLHNLDHSHCHFLPCS